ncbi:MAG: AmmeMemoRadiSam system protein B [Gracilibacteraceae bacterium]|jgi:AmmeMemoRadiSam system protein B|nr:AmmeMemoRadiSam system protein B [Gracilibacteraceae bacterium]
MSILAAFAVPHPPLIVPEVGRGEERVIQKTIDAYHSVAQAVSRLAPETVIVVSPHATCYRDYIHISPGAGARGDFARFGVAEVAARAAYDEDFAGALAEAAASLPAGLEGETDPELDHGVLIPLYFLNAVYRAYKLVRVGISALPPSAHHALGRLIGDTAVKLDRRAVFIASGDLSHRLLASGPYGFHPSGPRFDAWAAENIRTGAVENFLNPDEDLCAEAAECGLRPLQVLTGVLDGLNFTSELLSYEGPFGVGYAVASFEPEA